MKFFKFYEKMAFRIFPTICKRLGVSLKLSETTFFAKKFSGFLDQKWLKLGPE